MEACWSIQTEFPVKVTIEPTKGATSWRIEIPPMTLSYNDYEKLSGEIDHDRVYIDGVHVREFAMKNGLKGVLPTEINGRPVLPGRSGGSYSYETGKASFVFFSEVVCREHAKRLADRGLIHIVSLDNKAAQSQSFDPMGSYGMRHL